MQDLVLARVSLTKYLQLIAIKGKLYPEAGIIGFALSNACNIILEVYDVDKKTLLGVWKPVAPNSSTKTVRLAYDIKSANHYNVYLADSSATHAAARRVEVPIVGHQAGTAEDPSMGERWCYCDCDQSDWEAGGNGIQCANEDNCEHGNWFHVTCINSQLGVTLNRMQLTEMSKGDWYCMGCKMSQKKLKK